VSEQRVRRLAPARHDEQVAVDLASVELHAGEAPGPALGRDLANALLAQVDDLHDRSAGLLQEGNRVESALVGGDDDRAVAGLERPAPDEPTDRFRQHDPDQVVPREDQRLLDRARGDHDVGRPEAQEQGARIHRDEAALEDAERGPRDDLESLAGVGAGRVGLDGDDLTSCGRVPPCCLATRGPGADHEHIRAAMLDVVALLATAVLVDLSEPGDAAEEPLVERPETPRADHRPVVEADRGEEPADLVGHCQ
jgi:hypothetical protein